MFMPNWLLNAEGVYWDIGFMNVPTASFARCRHAFRQWIVG
jgi:hypothetical protein